MLTRRGWTTLLAVLIVTLGGLRATETPAPLPESTRPLIVAERPLPAPSRASRSGNRSLAQALARAEGWTGAEWACLDRLWNRESRWRHDARNPDTGAFGIPQKMGSISPSFEQHPAVQIVWGLNYIERRYGTPCAALEFHLKHFWY